jgi:hypothetical protein
LASGSDHNGCVKGGRVGGNGPNIASGKRPKVEEDPFGFIEGCCNTSQLKSQCITRKSISVVGVPTNRASDEESGGTSVTRINLETINSVDIGEKTSCVGSILSLGDAVSERESSNRHARGSHRVHCREGANADVANIPNGIGASLGPIGSTRNGNGCGSSHSGGRVEDLPSIANAVGGLILKVRGT